MLKTRRLFTAAISLCIVTATAFAVILRNLRSMFLRQAAETGLSFLLEIGYLPRRKVLIVVVMLSISLGLLLAGGQGAAAPTAAEKIVFMSSPSGQRNVFIMNPDGTGQTNLTNNVGQNENPSISKDGTKIVFSSSRSGSIALHTMNVDGSNVTNLGVSGSRPKFSPDGTKIVFSDFRSNNSDIYIMNSDGTGQIRLTTHPFIDSDPSFSPDGTAIVFSSNRNDNFEIYIMNSDGTFQNRLTYSSVSNRFPSFSPDGTKIAFSGEAPSQRDIFIMNLDGTDRINLTNNPADDVFPSFSPDGTKIAFTSTRDNDNLEIYSMNSDGTNQTRLTNSPDSDEAPSWGGITPPAPTVSGVVPASGSTAGGNVVTITGTNFTGATGVSFGGSACAITSNTATQIVCTTSAHAAGAVSVEVTTPGGTNAPNTLYTYQAETTVSVSSSVLIVTDGNGGTSNDGLTISLFNGNIRITDPNNPLSCGTGATQVNPNTCDVNPVNASRIVVETLGGNDTLTLDLNGGNFIPTGGVFYNGGDPTTGPGDKLNIIGGNQGLVTYNYTNASDGSVVMSNFGTITYTGLEPIVNSGTASDVVFNLPAGPNAATLADLGGGMSRLSGATFETTDFANPSGSVSINRGNAADTLTVNTLAANYPSLSIGTALAPFNLITFGGTVSLASGKNLTAFAVGEILVPNAASDITASGAGAISLTTARNIRMLAGSSIAVVDGDLTVEANQQSTATTGNFDGIRLDSASIEVTGTGQLSLSGRGGLGTSSRGVAIVVGSQVKGGGGGVIVTGTGGTTPGLNNYGVEVSDPTSQVTSTGGTVLVEGTAGVTVPGRANIGVRVGSGGVITHAGTTVGNTVTVKGFGTTAESIGVHVAGAGAQITSGGGAVLVEGTGGGTGSFNYGVNVSTDGSISSAGTASTATVTVKGFGGPTAGASNLGVLVNGPGAQITSGGGAVLVEGTGGGTGSSSDNSGVRAAFGGVITSAGIAGTATVTVKGIGGNAVGTGTGNNGVVVDNTNVNAARISSSGGSVLVDGTGTPTSSSEGVFIHTTGAVTSGNSADITISADSVRITAGSSGINSGSGQTTIRPRTAGTLIDLGGADVLTGSPLTLGLTDLELDRITAGTLDIGNATSGTITVSSDITRTAATNMTLVSDGDVIISGGQVNTGGGTLLLDPGISPDAVKPTKSLTDVTASTLSFGSDLAIAINGTTVDSQYNQLNVAGGVNVSGVSLVLSGSWTPTAGQQFVIVANDGTDAITGTFNGLPEGAEINPFLGSATVKAKISYVGGSGNDVVLTTSLINTPPTIVPQVGITRQAGTPAGAAVRIAGVTDPDQMLNTLMVTAMPPTGITVTGISVAANGDVTAVVTAGCNAPTGPVNVPLTVTDNQTATDVENLVVNVAANTAPAVVYPATTAVHGQTLTVTPTSATDNGSITNYQITNVSPALTTAPAINPTTGVVSITNARPVGMHTITIQATDDCGANSTTSFVLDVQKAGTTTAVTAAPASSVFGQQVTFTATVSANSPGAGLPTGTVTFSDGATVICPNVMLNASGMASCQTSALTAAGSPHTVNAVYAGDTSFTTSTGSIQYTVAKAGTTTALTAAPTSSVAGQQVTFTATVTANPPGAGLPTGTVTFSDGATVICPSVMLNGSGMASCQTSALTAPGSPHTITAVYSGDTNFTTSTGSIQYTVARAGTTTAVTAAPVSTVFGQQVTFTATVTPISPGSGVPTGTVTFFVGGTPICSNVMLNGSAMASCQTSALTAAGSPHTVNAVYAGDTSFAPSTGSIQYTVAKAPTTITPTNTAALEVGTRVGEAYSVSWIVTTDLPGMGTPMGIVRVTDGTDSCEAAVAVGTCRLTSTTEGAKNLVYRFFGDANFEDDEAAPVPHNVHPADVPPAQQPYLVVGADAGGQPLVNVVDFTGRPLASFLAYGGAFNGGVRVATGDVDGDGRADIITGAGAGATGGHVKVFDGRTYTELRSFFAFEGFSGGIYVAAGDVNGDGRADIIVGAGSGSANGHVKVFDGATGNLLSSFFAYTGFNGGVRVAAGDVNGDGRADIITGAGPGSPGGHVKVFDGRTGAEIRSFFAFQGFMGGVFVGVADINRDGSADITAATDSGAGPQVKVFSGADNTLLRSFFPYDPGFTGGARVALGDLDGDGIPDIATGPGVTGSNVRVFSGSTAGGQIASFNVRGDSFANGLFVAVSAAPTNLTAAPATGTFGGTTTLSATLRSGNTPVAGGIISFSLNGTAKGSALTNASGVATLTNVSLTGINAGTYPAGVSAVFSGDGTYDAASATAALTVNRSDTMTILTSAPDPSRVGEAVTMSFTVASTPAGAGAPTGRVEVTASTGETCSGPLSGAGTGTCLMVFAAAGQRGLTAVYSGDANFVNSTGTDTQTVNRAATTTTVTSSPDASVTGQSVTMNVTVAPNPAGAGTPTGTVTVTASTGESCTTGSVSAAGTATCSITFLTAGGRNLTAVYAGDINFLTSTGTDTQTVNRAATTTTLTSTPDASVTGQPVTMAFTVAPVAPGGGTPAGTVTVTAQSGETCTGTLTSGAGSCTITFTTTGLRNLTAVYSPALNPQNHLTSTGTDTHQVNTAGTTTTLTSSPDPSVTGQAVSMAFTVAATAPGTGTPGGTVTVTVSTGETCMGTLSGGAGSCTITFTTAGARNLTAVYSGNANYATSTGTDQHAVDPVATTTTITSDNPDASVSGQPVTVVVNVAANSPGAGVPAGTVNVAFSGGGETCTVQTLVGGNGQCTVVLTAPGTRTITATYAGSTNFATSSDTEGHTVNQSGTTTTITSDTPEPSVVGQAVAVAVTVAPAAPGTGTPTGTVTVSSPGETPCTITLISGAGTCNITFTSAGLKTITASYAATANFAPSSDTEEHSVGASNTTMTITTDTPDPSAAGQAVAVGVTVVSMVPGMGTPTGTVTVSSPGEMPCTITLAAGSGTCNITFTTAGPKTITATYNGTGGFSSSSDTEDHTVSGSGTTITITSDTPDPSNVGQAVAVAVTVASTAPGAGTPTGTVTVSSGGETSCTITLSSGAGTCNITFTSPGAKTITATYNGTASFAPGSDTEPHTVGVQISGNIQQSNAPNPNTPLGGVLVTLSGSSAAQTLTDASGNYRFDTLTGGGTYTVTPTAAGKAFSPANQTYANLTNNVTNANFTALDQGQLQRNLSVKTTFVESPNQVFLPIILTALGPERTVRFSLGYNNAALMAPLAICGADAAGCTITQDTSVAGAIGITVVLNTPVLPGERDIVRVRFNTLSSGQANTPVVFADSPTARSTTDAANTQLTTSYTGGFVVFTAEGLEGDLAPRFSGDNLYRSNDVEQARRFVSGLDQPNALTNEFERADVAPYAVKGDGRMRADDLQTTMNYVAGLAARQTAGGPDQAIAGSAPLEESQAPATGRAMRIVDNWSTGGSPVRDESPGRAVRAPQKASIAVEIDSLGDETVALFTLGFDASKLTNPTVTLAEGMPEGITLTANTQKAADGQITVLLDSAAPFTTGYSKRVVIITFDIAKDATGDTPITFNGSGSFADADAKPLDAVYTDGVINIKESSIRRGLSFFTSNLFRLSGMGR